MKKTNIFIALVVLIATSIIVVISCDKKKTTEPTTTQPKHSMPAKKFDGDLSNYPDAITKDAANAMISAYANDQNKLATTSFLYNASELLSYINNCENIQYLNFFIGEYTDANNNLTLSLIFCGVDNNGNHIYITDANNVEYALDYAEPCPMDCPSNGQNLETPGSSNLSVTASYSQNMAVSTAQTWVANYINDQKKNTGAVSFLYDPTVLASYIGNAQGINKIHFLLAEDNNGKLTMVISGVDANGNHIYITDGQGNYFALENCYPCPTCNQVTNGGLSLE